MVAIHPLVLSLCLAAGSETVLLDFSSEHCGPCRMMQPTVGRLAESGYPVRQINVDRDPQTASRFGVTGIPCFVMLRNGREVDRVVGATSHSRLLQMFASAGFQPPSATESASQASIPPSRQPRAVSARGQSPTNSPAPMNNPAPTGDQWAHAASHTEPPTRADSNTDAVGSDRISSNGDPQEVRQRAFQATVRLTVEDPKGQSVGTGTIVDTHGAEALVLTCGHIFRFSQGKGRISVILFSDGKEQRTVTGNLVNYDLDRDIGLVSIVPKMPVESVQIDDGRVPTPVGTAVFTVGCNQGGPPTLINSQITAIDKYVGPPNIEVFGQPEEGRSGGGLFAADTGHLIGICNMVDKQDHEGIYAALATIHWELDRIGLRSIYQSCETSLVDNRHRNTEETVPSMPETMPSHLPDSRSRLTEISEAGISRTTTSSQSLAELASGATEIICIIRRNGQEQLVVLDKPSPDLLQLLAQESGSAESNGGITLEPHRDGPSPASWPGRRLASGRSSAGDQVRAQSIDR